MQMPGGVYVVSPSRAQAREQQAELRPRDWQMWRELGQAAWMWFGVMGSHQGIKGRGVSGLSDFSTGCPGNGPHP